MVLQQTVLSQAISGTRPLPKKSKYKKINLALQTIFERRETLDFLRGCSYNVEMNVQFLGFNLLILTVQMSLILLQIKTCFNNIRSIVHFALFCFAPVLHRCIDHSLFCFRSNPCRSNCFRSRDRHPQSIYSV